MNWPSESSPKLLKRREIKNIFHITERPELSVSSINGIHSVVERSKRLHNFICLISNAVNRDSLEAPPWNLRTRGAASNEPGDEPTRITGLNRGSNE
ncbi:hypothetical protein Bca52824_035193 [Brassica carinata]|uniref:Uncharacterized protein n=1 Tax=Brassica carinata TaxID=52824 RepID=A0A8X7S368_BRACI|nr:hypothetical protein Bca52824_035193 [Brassica carinata]